MLTKGPLLHSCCICCQRNKAHQRKSMQPVFFCQTFMCSMALCSMALCHDAVTHTCTADYSSSPETQAPWAESHCKHAFNLVSEVKLLPFKNLCHRIRLCSFMDSPIAALTCIASQIKKSPGDENRVSIIARQIHQQPLGMLAIFATVARGLLWYVFR